MGILAATTHTKNGGFTDLGRSSADYRIRGAIPEYRTKPVTVASGQVLKAMSWVETNTAGKVIAKAPLVEIGTVKFTAAITNGQTMIIAGLTWTAGASGTTAAQLYEAWAGITSGTGYAALADRTGGGSFTAGTLTGYTTTAVGDNTILFQGQTVADLTAVGATGTGAASASVTATNFAASNRAVGLLAMDVDATSADVQAQVITGGNFWQEAIHWGNSDVLATVVNHEGTPVTVTAYQTGCNTNLLKQKFMELCAGDVDIVIGDFLDTEREV